MIRKATILLVFALVTGTATAVVGHNNTGDGDMSIMSGGPASTTTGVGENGTEYRGSVEMRNISATRTENQINNITHSDSAIEFSGAVRASTPCHVLGKQINQTDEGYILNIETVRDELNGEACTEVVAGIKYDAEFEADPGFELEVQHNGETVETITHETQEEPKENMSLIERILAFLGL